MHVSDGLASRAELQRALVKAINERERLRAERDEAVGLLALIRALREKGE